MKPAVVVCLLLLGAQLMCAQAAKQLTIESLFAAGGITGKEPEALQWSPDGAKVSFVQHDAFGNQDGLAYFDVAKRKLGTLVSAERLANLAPPAGSAPSERQKEWIGRYGVASYQWAPDSKHLLFDAQGALWLYSLQHGTAVQVAPSVDFAGDPKFSPDGSRLAYVQKHNLYVRSLAQDEEKALTANEDQNILSGEVDWLYAEELAVRSNYFWSPDGRQIAFLEMDERRVPTYPIVDWDPTHANVEWQKYPKAGDPNPEVRLGVVSADGGKVKWIDVGDRKEREYIPRFGWVRPGLVYIELLNRAQNKLELWFAETNSGHARKMLTEAEPHAWVPVEHAPEMQLLKSGDGFLWPSWRDGYMHVYLYRFNKDNPLEAEAALERKLTAGNFDVESIDAVDNAGTVYLTANAADPRQQQIYAVKLDGSLPLRPISREEGSHQGTFSPTAAYYVDSFSTTMTPPRISFCALAPASASPAGPVANTCTTLWESSSLEEYRLLTPRKLQLKAADGTTVLYGTLLLPPDLPPGARAPLINSPYGGPGVQTVTDSWGGAMFLFDQILARGGFAVLHVDNRGMDGRGKAFAAAALHNFGPVQLADQLAAIQQVQTDYPQIDSERLGWWGWSYGGYMTLYAMTYSEKVKAGAAVAPVTNWHDYDSTYTERYLGLPGENEWRYRTASPVYAAGSLKGHLLEAHGASDDNVHVQNTMQMVNALIENGVQFDLQLYPGKTHGIGGVAARTHLFHRLQDHFQHWLQ